MSDFIRTSRYIINKDCIQYIYFESNGITVKLKDSVRLFFSNNNNSEKEDIDIILSSFNQRYIKD